MISIETFILLTSFIISLILYFKDSRTYWQKKNVPTLPGHFLYGNLQAVLFGQAPGLGVQIGELYKQFKENGINNYAGFYAVTKPMFLSIDLDLTKKILNADYQYFDSRGLYHSEHQPMSQHVLNCTGQRWRNLRNKLTPTFTSGKMRMMFDTVNQTAEPLLEKVDEYSRSGEPINIQRTFLLYITDIIGRCAFGIECNCLQEGSSKFLSYIDKVFVPDFKQLMKLQMLMSFPKVCKKLGIKQFPTETENFFGKIVEDIVTYRGNSNVSRKDYMQLLIEIKKEHDNLSFIEDKDEFAIKDILAHTFLFFVAGFETGSYAMTFALYELAENLEIQEKARSEIRSVLKKYSNVVCYDAIKEMKYLSQIIEESLRKYPVLPMIPRECTRDYNIPGTDIIIKKGTSTFVSVLGMHMDPKYYPDPMKFNPDRFTTENKAKRDPFTYLPFGGGPKMCIGLRFAIMEIKVGLSALLNKYQFTLNEKTKIPFKYGSTVSLSVVGEVWLNVKEIQSNL